MRPTLPALPNLSTTHMHNLATLLFDPSVSALPIIMKQNSQVLVIPSANSELALRNNRR